MKKLHRAEGFTLIELMIVILIIAILVAIAVPIYINATNNAKKRTCQANLRTIDGAQNTWRATTEVAPPAGTDVAGLVASGYLKKAPSCPASNPPAGYVMNANMDASCVNSATHTYP